MVQNGVVELTRRDLYRAVFRHKKKGLAFFLAVIALAAAATGLSPRTYRSEGTLLVRLGRENATLDPTATLGRDPVVSFGASREDELNSVVEILSSQAILEQVVEAIGEKPILREPSAVEGGKVPKSPPSKTSPGEPAPQPDPSSSNGSGERNAPRAAPTKAAVVDWQLLDRWRRASPEVPARERAVRRLSDHLEVYAGRDSNLVHIAYEADDPELAQRVVAELIDCYLQQHVRLFRTQGSREFLEEQTAHLRKELTTTETALRDLKNETGLAAPEEQREIVVEQIGRLEDELATAEVARAASQARVERLRSSIAELPKTELLSQTSGHPNEAADRMRQRLFDLEIQLEEYRARYTGEHPLLQEVRQQVAAAQEILGRETTSRDQVTSGKSSTFGEAELALLEEETRLAELEAKTIGLETELASARARAKTLNADLVQIAKLQRELDLHESNYRKYATNLEQSRIDEALELERISNISVVQHATRNFDPVHPKVAVNVLLALAVGTLGGLALTLTSQYLDHTFDTPEEVERELGLPVLVSVPRMPKRWLAIGSLRR